MKAKRFRIPTKAGCARALQNRLFHSLSDIQWERSFAFSLFTSMRHPSITSVSGWRLKCFQIFDSSLLRRQKSSECRSERRTRELGDKPGGAFGSVASLSPGPAAPPRAQLGHRAAASRWSWLGDKPATALACVEADCSGGAAFPHLLGSLRN